MSTSLSSSFLSVPTSASGDDRRTRRLSSHRLDSSDSVSLSSTPAVAASASEKSLADAAHAELKDKYEALLRENEELKSYALVTTSREVLQRQLDQANERVADLMTENAELERENRRLRERLQDAQEELDSSGSTTRPNAEGFSQRFGLPETEKPLSRYRCSNDNGKRGRLFVTENHLCFHPKFNKDQDTVTIPFTSIICIERMKAHSYTVGSGHAVEMLLTDASKRTFRNFYNVSGAMQDIVTQAQKNGHIIKVVEKKSNPNSVRM